MYLGKETRDIMKKLYAFCLAAILLFTMIPQTVSASSVRLDFTAKTSGSGNAIQVKKVKYDGQVVNPYFENEDGALYELEIDFLTNVMWKQSAGISSVKDNKGKTYRAYLSDKDNDECDIYIVNLKEGRTYTIVIQGIKTYGSDSYRNLTLKVKIPSGKKAAKGSIPLSKVEVEEDGYSLGEIDIKFATKVAWRHNAKVTSVKDNKGKSYRAYLKDRDDDDCEVYIYNMKYGRTYTIKISGVKARGSASYKTITVKVKAPAKQSGVKVKKVEYDADDDDGRMEYTVNFDFNKRIQFKHNSYVIIQDASGKAYSSKSSHVDWDDDECEVFLSDALTIGQKYTYKIVNVKAAGSGSYTTLTGTFTAYYD